ncbi:hypothetical protein [Rhizobium sp. TH135]|uniref:hypothetical protein n=1 Tax=Rhizobium sp. TH135 TaxID=2067451 RepID=UPI000C7D4CD5|nr:hypothetical protein [Rhizobium sp. TH135]
MSFSASLDVGEVYSYSEYYKRAFWYFGDDLTTWLAPLYLFSVLRRQRLLAIGLAGAAFLSGGRIGLILVAIQALFIIGSWRREQSRIAPSIGLSLIGGVIVYFVVVSTSSHAIRAANSAILHFNLESSISLFEPTRRGFSDCRIANCFDRKVKRPFRMRTLSAVAGLWMTLEGGFPGSRYPDTPEKFAELIVKANPWGVNDRYGVTREEWMRIGTVQSPYVGFGAGYGPALLALAMGFIGAVCLVGLWVLSVRPPDAWTPLTVFFIVNAIFNQTQAWLQPGPVLFAMGLCGTHILWQYFSFGARGQDQPLPGSNPVVKEV